MNIKTNETNIGLPENQTFESFSEDSEIKDYVSKFQGEIEQKFGKSKVNNKFRFPKTKKTLKKIHCIKQNGDSMDSLKDVLQYDLYSKDVKRNLLLNRDKIKDNGKWLAELVKSIGKLNQQYLESQFQNQNSVFFVLLQEAINKNRPQNKQTKIQTQLNKQGNTSKSVFQINNKLKTKSKNSEKSQNQKSLVQKVQSQKSINQRKTKNKSQLKKRTVTKDKDIMLTSRSCKKESFRKTKIENNKSSIFQKLNQKSVKLIKKNFSNESHKNFEKSIVTCNKTKGNTTRIKQHLSKQKKKQVQLPLTFTKEQLNNLIKKNFEQIHKQSGKNPKKVKRDLDTSRSKNILQPNSDRQKNENLTNLLKRIKKNNQL